MWLGVGSIFGYHAPVQVPVTLGDYNVTGGGTYRLQSSVSSTQTTVTLTSFKEPISNIPYTMSYLNSTIEYGTVDPQNATSKEFISFTGITQNSNGTATLTGVSRGLSPSYPFTASSTFRAAHSGQSIFILSNPPQLYNSFYNLSNNATSTNTLVFSSTTPPRYDLVPINQASGTYVSTTSEFASVALVNAVLSLGCAVGTEGVTGCLRLSTQLQMASSTFVAGTPTVLYSKYATSSPSIFCGLCIPITQNDGKLSPLFIATSSLYTYRFGSSMFYTGTETYSSAATIISSSTNIHSGLNTFLGTTTMATTTATDLRNSYGASYGGKLAVLTTPQEFGASSTATTTVFSFDVPGNFIATSSIVHIRIYWGVGGSQGTQFTNGAFRFALNYGGVGKAYKTIPFTGTSGGSGFFDAVIMGNGTTQSQYGMINLTGTPESIGNLITAIGGTGVGTYSINSQTTQTASVTASFGTSDPNNSMYIYGGYAEIIN